MLELSHDSPESETVTSYPVPTEWRPDIVIHHFPCDDGFGAALACMIKYLETGQPEYHGASYGSLYPDVIGKNVLICDFSYPEPVLLEMAGIAKSIVVLDHHKTAEEALAKYAVSDRDLVNVTNIQLELDACADGPQPLPLVALFDMERSGAGMTWDFLFPGNPRPYMFNLLEDRDLWRFKHEDTEAFTMYLRTKPFDLGVWAGLMYDLQAPFTRQDILKQGAAIKAYHDNKVRELLGQVVWTKIGNRLVPTVNANWCFSSDLGHLLLQVYPEAPFAATYFNRGDGRQQYSLRSEDSRVDVGAVAKMYGGGGHRNAAGFETSYGFEEFYCEFNPGR